MKAIQQLWIVGSAKPASASFGQGLRPVALYLQRTCPVLKRTCLGYNATDGTANGPVHVDMGNGGFEFTWFANPTPPPYWDSNYMAHGYNRVYANGTYIHMQVSLELRVA